MACLHLLFFFAVLPHGFAFSSQTKPYLEARATCQKQGGDIVSNLKTAHDFATWNSLLETFSGFPLVWYGAYDAVVTPKTFRTLDGTEIPRTFNDYFPWYSGGAELTIPSEQCIVGGVNIDPKKFYDIECSEKSYPICQSKWPYVKPVYDVVHKSCY